MSTRSTSGIRKRSWGLPPWLCMLALAGMSLTQVSCKRPAHPVPAYAHERTAAQPSNPAPAAAPRPVQARPFLWSVQAGERPSFLFGTIHVGVALEEALGPQRLREIEQSRAVIVEIDPAAVNRHELAEAARLPSGTLNEKFRASIWHDLVNELHTTHSATALRSVRPWYPMVVLTHQRVAQLHGGRLPPAMDLSIVQLARRTGRAVLPLETPAQQFEMLNALPEADVVSVVAEMVTNAETQNRELQRMLDAYRGGDDAALVELIFEPNDVVQMPEFFNLLFYRRNDAWMQAIKAEIDQGGVFVAVGLGHLLGPEGLVAQLRSTGYQVTRIAQ